MKEFTYNLTVVCTFAAILALAGFTTGCTWTTYRPHTVPATSKANKVNLVGKSACFEKEGIEHCGKVKKLSAKPRFVPVPMGRDAYGIRVFSLPADHALLALGYEPGEILASFNGESFSVDRLDVIGRVMRGDLAHAHLTVIRDGREVTLEPVEGHHANLIGSGPEYDPTANLYAGCPGNR